VQLPGATHRNIYVASERAGKRVMQSVTSFLRRRLKLKVNETKSAVAGAEVSGLQLHLRNRPETAHCAQGSALLQAKSTGTDAPEARSQSATDDEGPGQLLTWLEGLLRLQPDALGAATAGRMDPTQVAIHDLEAMEAKAGAVSEAALAEHRRCPGGSNRRQSP
jgi:hypothetical protein